MFKAQLFLSTHLYHDSYLVVTIWKFYNQNYDIIYQQFITSTMKSVTLSSDLPVKKCRFCGKENGEYVVTDGKKEKVTFRKISHVIPESLGNKKLFMDYECDLCNAEFGSGIEDQFGNWSIPMRTLARIRGKNGVPTLKKNLKDNSWRLEYTEGKLVVTSDEKNPVFKIDEENKNITLCIKRDTYVPRDVLKAFIKMGLSLIPDSELLPFEPLISWIKGDESLNPFIEINYTFRPGAFPNDLIVLIVMRRKVIVDHVPYAFFILSYGNEVFQIPLLAYNHDKKIIGKSIIFPYFPSATFKELDVCGIKPRYLKLDLNDICQVKNEQFVIKLGYENLQREIGYFDFNFSI